MREFLQLPAIVVLVIASMAQTPATQSGQADKRHPDPCTISGRVVTAAEGTPIKSARVALVEQNAGRHPHVFAASTDSDGRFEIKKVDPGRYEFVASHTAYISQRYQARGTNDGAILALVPGQEVNAVLFRLVRGGAITGRVIDEAGEPMVNVTVSVLQKPSGEEIEEAGLRGKKRELLESSWATTDDRGEYRVSVSSPAITTSRLRKRIGHADRSSGMAWSGRSGGSWAANMLLSSIQEWFKWIRRKRSA